MAYSDIVNVAISLDIAAVSRAGFGILLFAAPHTRFGTRTKAYTSITEVAADFPTTSNVYIALQGAFSADVPPEQVKVGRQKVDSVSYTPIDPPAIGTVYSITVVPDDGVPFDVSYTSIALDTATEVATGLEAAATDGQGLTFTDGGGTLDVAIGSSNAYVTTNVTTNLTESFVTTEDIVDTINEIVIEDDDFYFFTSYLHDETNVLAIAADMEARTKLYFVALQNAENLVATAPVIASGDIMSQLQSNAYFRTSAWYHHEADTKYPECNYVTVASPSDPGKKIWANNRVTGTTAARDIDTNLLLSASQKGILNDKSANYTEIVGNITITRRGTVSGGETFLVSLVRSRDFLIARITEAYQNFLINSPVVPYTESGIAATYNVLSSELGRYVETETQPNILQRENPFIINFPRRVDISTADVAAGVFMGSFTAFLSGAIREIAITGSLTYQGS